MRDGLIHRRGEKGIVIRGRGGKRAGSQETQTQLISSGGNDDFPKILEKTILSASTERMPRQGRKRSTPSSDEGKRRREEGKKEPLAFYFFNGLLEQIAYHSGPDLHRERGGGKANTKKCRR